MLVVTDYGLAGIGFADAQTTIENAFEDLRRRWPNARYRRDDARMIPVAQRVFDPTRWDPEQPVKLVLIGTDFEVKVWETLLKILVGRATTYQSVAEHIGVRRHRGRWVQRWARTPSALWCPPSGRRLDGRTHGLSLGRSRASGQYWVGKRA